MYEIILTEIARDMLLGISDTRTRKSIKSRIDALKKEPDKQGKELIHELAGFRSVRAAGQRYRIIYRVEKTTVIVYVLAIGLRKDGDRRDIYSLARKLIKLGLVE